MPNVHQLFLCLFEVTVFLCFMGFAQLAIVGTGAESICLSPVTKFSEVLELGGVGSVCQTLLQGFRPIALFCLSAILSSLIVFGRFGTFGKLCWTDLFLYTDLPWGGSGRVQWLKAQFKSAPLKASERLKCKALVQTCIMFEQSGFNAGCQPCVVVVAALVISARTKHFLDVGLIVLTCTLWR